MLNSTNPPLVTIPHQVVISLVECTWGIYKFCSVKNYNKHDYQFQGNIVSLMRSRKKKKEKKRPKLTNHGTAAGSSVQFTFKLHHLLAKKGTAAFTPADRLQGRKTTLLFWFGNFRLFYKWANFFYIWLHSM